MSGPVLDAPPAAYAGRAGVNPRPPGLDDDLRDAHSHDVALQLQESGLTFYADWSEFQPVVDDSYPYVGSSIRLDTGYRLDNHARANWSFIHASKRIEFCIGYVVFIPGQSSMILQRLRGAFGSHCPPKLAVEIDMESGSGFAGPGNHSSEANDFAAALAEWTGSRARELGYANAPDWSSNWPTHPTWLKRTLAFYSASATPSGYFARQYYGGLNYPTPSGYPRSCKPFGSWIDMNVIPRTVNGALDALGLDWLSMATEAQVQAAMLAALKSPEGQKAIKSGVSDYFRGSDGVLHGVEGFLSHVTQGHPYYTGKGQVFPALARRSDVVQPAALSEEDDALPDAVADVDRHAEGDVE